jgi:hypothetical protein
MTSSLVGGCEIRCCGHAYANGKCPVDSSPVATLTARRLVITFVPTTGRKLEQ